MTNGSGSRRSQRGAVTLLMTLVLSSLILITTLTGAKVAVMATKTAASDSRLRQVKQAAEAGLEHGVAWLRENKCVGGCAAVTASTINSSMGYSFTPNATFTANNGYLLVTSTAVANEDAAINAISQQFVRQTDFLTPAGNIVPPMVVDGCLSSPSGNPSIYPRPGRTAVLTLATDNPGDGTGSGCIDVHGPGSHFHFSLDLCSSSGSAATCSPADTSTATAIAEADIPDYLDGIDLSAEPEPRAWNHVFAIALADAKARASAAGQVYGSDSAVPAGPAPDTPFLVYTGSAPFNGSGSKVYGSAASPVVIIVTDTGCPVFQGGVTVYGFIYYEADPVGTCTGWGGANVIGSLILEGDARGFNANVSFFDVSNIGGGGAGSIVFLDDVARIFGTWKDW